MGLFHQEPFFSELYEIAGGNKVGTIGGKLMFPANGDKITVEIQTPDGQTWTETGTCGAPQSMGSMARLIITPASCPGIDGKQ